ncbi:MAG: MBOAT family protein [Solobacterium sp.]|nr:MBOAT family protein [Solobacterium sp.]
MSYTSWQYFAMILVLLPVYYLLPKKHRWIVLLAGSVFFYVRLIRDWKQLLVFGLSIVLSYCFSLMIQITRRKKKIVRLVVLWAGILLSSLPLLLYRVGGLFGSTSWIVPVGLSFYTLQMIAYLTDVYRKKVRVQVDPLKYALFISFFPQIIQGPIPRYNALEKGLFEGNDYDFDHIVSGLQLVLWGFFLKYMIADSAAVFVNNVFDQFPKYTGGYVLLAGILYSLQLYADFLSCTSISQGVAGMFGITLGENFCRPYFADSVKDFWRRWHISLSSWLRDYIYIPLGGNRRGKLMRWINLVIVFAVSGLWHGGSGKFLVWGLLHAFYQILGELFTPGRRNSEHAPSGILRPFRQLLTFFLVMIGWIIFRADTLKTALEMLGSMFTEFTPELFTGRIFKLGLNQKEFIVLLFSVILLWLVGYLQEKGVVIRSWIMKRNIVIRWGIYFAVIWLIWICGSYGYGFNAADFIYGGF